MTPIEAARISTCSTDTDHTRHASIMWLCVPTFAAWAGLIWWSLS